MSQSVRRALLMLRELGEGPKTLDQLAATAGVHKTTVLRLLRTLEEQRFAHRDDARHYRLGSALFDLASQALEQRDVRAASAGALARLSRDTGHTVHLASYEDGEVVYIDKVDGTHSVRMYSRVGKRAPVHCTAVGKVLVAALPPAERAELAARLAYPRLTANTIGEAGAFLAELDQVARRGYAVDNAEHEDFIQCIAAPVRGADGSVQAAISVSVPKVLVDLDGLLAMVPALLTAAEQASLHNGWTTNRGKEH